MKHYQATMKKDCQATFVSLIAEFIKNPLDQSYCVWAGEVESHVEDCCYSKQDHDVITHFEIGKFYSKSGNPVLLLVSSSNFDIVITEEDED